MAAKTGNKAKKTRVSVAQVSGAKSPSSSDKVVDTILQRLLSGLFVPGQRLVEVELASQCGVSRGSVREAFKRLSAQGIITLSPHRGACIRQLSRQEVIDILQIQAVLAGLGAGLAAKHIDRGDYRKQLDSNVADMKNIGGPHGGALTAGLFLQEFVADGIPWAHIDLAGPAFTDADDTETAKGGTGFGVRLLVHLLRNFQKPAS